MGQRLPNQGRIRCELVRGESGHLPRPHSRNGHGGQWLNRRYRRWASRLVDGLVREGFEAVTVLDLSQEALARAKARLGAQGSKVRWIVAGVTTWEPTQTYDVWHDRATFHFSTEEKDRVAYSERVSRAVSTGGHVIIGTFALDGPERCSGLPTMRHDAASLARMLGPSFELVECRNHMHLTPVGSEQHFQFSHFRRSR
ncbi:MAG: class I SAM-dependent methyltransferase [Hyphomicrobium sp.]